MKKGYIIPFFLVLIIALSAIVGSVTYITTASVRNINSKIYEQRSHYIAEAGIYKALWYLIGPEAEGAQGMTWRTTGVTEEFGGGNYTIVIENYPIGGYANTLKITSIGTYNNKQDTIQLTAYEDFIDVFTNYALYSSRDFDMTTSNIISGNFFADGNVLITTGSKIKDGIVAVTGDHGITGEGEYIVGSSGDVPTVPPFDTTYYDNQLAVVAAGGASVVQGDQSYSGLNLNGQTLYVNGNVTITGVITGPGEIVASGNLIVSKYTDVAAGIKLIAGNRLDVDYHKVDMRPNVILYGAEKVITQGNLTNEWPIFIFTPKELYIGNNNLLNGRFYGGKIDFGLSTIINGVVIIGSYGEHVLHSNSSIIHQKFEQSIPPGFPTRLVLHKWQ
ncbi:MAG: hypothetical protein ABIH22_04080 [Candidatus Margulisiibacteriota bacterium]